MARQIKVVLLDENKCVVAEKDMDPMAVAGVSVFQFEGVNYAFTKLEGKAYAKAIFEQCGSIEEF